ncbi:MAG: anti-sigma factor [Chloroflexota bacterium]|nr:anti-sigma factor [Dehalococcoidia bacterium]MDW8252303.1 anti-sigma factor [Chloroflexota bacterium]
MTCADVRDLYEAAAVRALDLPDWETLKQHLADCAACRQALEAAEEIAVVLAMTVPQVTPPARLKERILAAAQQEAHPAPAAQTPRRVRLPAPSFGRLGMLATAASLLAAIGFALLAFTLASELETQRQLNASLTQGLQGQEDLVQLISSQPQLMSYLTGTPQWPTARGRMYASGINDTALLLVDGLKPLPPDRVYQVWLMEAGQPHSGGVFTVDTNGQGRWVVRADKPILRYQAIIVTEEPAGGSPMPTSPRVLTGLF